MFSALSLPDLDALDPAALKAMILAQQDHFKAQHERYTAALSSRTSEIERLTLLVEKLKHMLFGRKSEKVLRQIEQLELQIEDLEVATVVEETHAIPPAKRPAPAKPSRRALPEHLPREVHTLTCRSTRLVPTAASVCDRWAKTWPRCWSTFEPASR